MCFVVNDYLFTHALCLISICQKIKILLLESSTSGITIIPIQKFDNNCVNEDQINKKKSIKMQI